MSSIERSDALEYQRQCWGNMIAAQARVEDMEKFLKPYKYAIQQSKGESPNDSSEFVALMGKNTRGAAIKA